MGLSAYTYPGPGCGIAVTWDMECERERPIARTEGNDKGNTTTGKGTLEKLTEALGIRKRIMLHIYTHICTYTYE